MTHPPAPSLWLRDNPCSRPSRQCGTRSSRAGTGPAMKYFKVRVSVASPSSTSPSFFAPNVFHSSVKRLSEHVSPSLLGYHTPFLRGLTSAAKREKGLSRSKCFLCRGPHDRPYIRPSEQAWSEFLCSKCFLCEDQASAARPKERVYTKRCTDVLI